MIGEYTGSVGPKKEFSFRYPSDILEVYLSSDSNGNWLRFVNELEEINVDIQWVP